MKIKKLAALCIVHACMLQLFLAGCREKETVVVYQNGPDLVLEKDWLLPFDSRDTVWLKDETGTAYHVYTIRSDSSKIANCIQNCWADEDIAQIILLQSGWRVTLDSDIPLAVNPGTLGFYFDLRAGKSASDSSTFGFATGIVNQGAFVFQNNSDHFGGVISRNDNDQISSFVKIGLAQYHGTVYQNVYCSRLQNSSYVDSVYFNKSAGVIRLVHGAKNYTRF
jgi:hypothetical protein